MREHSSDESSAGPFGISITKYRAGAPGLLPLPVRRDGRVTRQRLGDDKIEEIQRAAAGILDKRGIKEPKIARDPEDYIDLAWSSTEPFWRISVVESSVSHGSNESKYLTLWIQAEWYKGCEVTWEKLEVYANSGSKPYERIC
ncbi:hypothetical protein B0I35DRAFT_108927 [Stachybotrys elegans]|uniref:Uncharacterized protein n=1 Tax=Stachybotrys elegans TaxID=80388 RepID=A0A8K0WLN2_9HYPO|nr:hypothetical protein B0I35DRAFT_108927 [Stachybotrys elegans]